MNSDHHDREKKPGGFRRFLGGGRDKHHSTQSQGLSATDSGYATSEGPSSNPQSSEVVPGTSRNNENYPHADRLTARDIARDDNLEVEPSGDVVDKKSGQVVTTVTTVTTTTTTTTTTGPGGQAEPQVEQRRQEHVNQSQPTISSINRDRDSGNVYDYNTASNRVSNVPTEASLGDSYNQPSTIPSNTTQTTTHGNTPSATQPSIYGSHTTQANPTTTSYQPNQSYGSPPIPAKSSMRDGINRPINEDLVSPVSPSKHNFSYPSRTVPSGVTPDHARTDSVPPTVPGTGGAVELDGGTATTVTPSASQRSTTGLSPGTIANLKAAAMGLHGVGETLRGTINSSIDRHYQLSRDPARNAQISAKNQAVIDAGKREMEQARLNAANRQQGQAGGGLNSILRRPVTEQNTGNTGTMYSSAATAAGRNDQDYGNAEHREGQQGSNLGLGSTTHQGLGNREGQLAQHDVNTMNTTGGYSHNANADNSYNPNNQAGSTTGQGYSSTNSAYDPPNNSGQGFNTNINNNNNTNDYNPSNRTANNGNSSSGTDFGSGATNTATSKTGMTNATGSIAGNSANTTGRKFY